MTVVVNIRNYWVDALYVEEMSRTVTLGISMHHVLRMRPIKIS